MLWAKSPISANDPMRHGTTYAPSYQEQRAIEATLRKNYDEAALWYDRAIIADESRGPRIFDQCCSMKSRLSSVYSALFRYRDDPQKYSQHIKAIFDGHPELSAKNRQALNDDIPALQSAPSQGAGSKDTQHEKSS